MQVTVVDPKSPDMSPAPTEAHNSNCCTLRDNSTSSYSCITRFSTNGVDDSSVSSSSGAALTGTSSSQICVQTWVTEQLLSAYHTFLFSQEPLVRAFNSCHPRNAAVQFCAKHEMFQRSLEAGLDKLEKNLHLSSLSIDKLAEGIVTMDRIGYNNTGGGHADGGGGLFGGGGCYEEEKVPNYNYNYMNNDNNPFSRDSSTRDSHHCLVELQKDLDVLRTEVFTYYWIAKEIACGK